MTDEKNADEAQDEGGGFPRRRRHVGSEDNVSSKPDSTPPKTDPAEESRQTMMDTPSTEPSEKPTEPTKPSEPTVPAATDDVSGFRRRRSAGADAKDASPDSDTADGTSKSPPPPANTKEDALDTTPDKPVEGDKPADPKRALRLVILFMLVGIAAFWMVMLLGPKSGQSGGGVAGGTISQGPVDRETLNTKEADSRADELSILLKAGDHKAALEKATITGMETESVTLREQVYLAKAVAGLLANAAKLEELPSPEPTNPTLSVQVNVARQEARLPCLARLANYRRDWGRMLTALPEAKPVFAKYDAEIASARGNVRTWGAAASLLDRARTEALKDQPDFQRLATLMRSAASRVPLEPLLPTAEDAARIGTVESSIARRQLDDAVQALNEITIDRVPAPTDPPETALATIQGVLRQRHADAKKRIGAWGDLQALSTKSIDLHETGRTQEAITAITAMLDAVDRSNPLTRDLINELETRQTHYRQVLDAFANAMKTKAEKGIAEQLQVWAAFQGVIDRKKDNHYFRASIEELKLIKDIIQKRIATSYDELIQIAAPFKRITARMRRPESDRAAFAEQAKILRAMAEKAIEIIKTNDLVSSWRLGDTTEDQVNYARNVMSDHADQSQRLWDLSALYRERGRLPEARECAQRVLILGDVGKNPWYDEAKKWIEGGARGNTNEEASDS